MKRFTSFAAAVAIMACATPAQAQLTFNWDENNQFIFYPEDLVCDGGVIYDEDNGCFVFDGTPGSIMIDIPEGQTFDWTEVASIEVIGSLADENGEDHELTYYAWNAIDPLATFTVRDRDILNGDGENIVNTWMGSRYKINYSSVGDKEYHNGQTYAALSAHVTQAVWGTRNTEDEEGNVTAVPGEIYIDEIIFTKSKEMDPMAITPEMFGEWSNWDETGEWLQAAGCEYLIGDNVGTGTTLYGTGSVLGRQYADLTEYAGIYAKGTPGVSLRLLFNRPDMEGGSAPVTECNPTFNEEGEFYFYFAELELAEIEKFGSAYPYVHLNAVKTPWGFPEGVESAKITKLNYIEKGESGIENVNVDGLNGDGVMYNVMGMPVNENYKGIVIKNGKKFILR